MRRIAIPIALSVMCLAFSSASTTAAADINGPPSNVIATEKIDTNIAGTDHDVGLAAVHNEVLVEIRVASALGASSPAVSGSDYLMFADFVDVIKPGDPIEHMEAATLAHPARRGRTRSSGGLASNEYRGLDLRRQHRHGQHHIIRT